MASFVTHEDKQVLPIIINNTAQPITPTTNLTPVHNSLTPSPVHHFASATPADCTSAISAAWHAFQVSAGPANTPWKRATVTTRRTILLKAADLFEARRSTLVSLQKLETSCDDAWAGMNVTLAVNYIREIAACISQIQGTIPPIDKPDTMAFVYKDPVGPVLVIPPWNGALVLAGRAVTTAIAAGCTVVMKASELSPACHHAIWKIYEEAGLPAGVLNVVCSRRETAGEVTEGIIKDDRIRKIEFIGSAAVGRVIGATAAKYLKPCLMELGGKCPAIVLDDADVGRAAVLCAKGAVMNHGQICFSTERIIVMRGVKDEFLAKVKGVVEGTEAGSAVSEGIAKHAVDVLQDAKEKGCEFLTGAPEMQEGNKVKPSLVVVDAKATKDEVRIVDEETFGPSASIYIVDSEEEAVELANRSAYGLNATVHTTNLERGIKVGRELEYGQVHINSITVFTSATGPQGGRTGKSSGWGRQNAMYGLNEYLDDKFITYHGKNSG
ncbi:aldehyde dehydrogenase-like protein 6 [Elsinoe australis]|uniref:Aldehyde dehydrogenase-like protein 6 n=1 Tax=Elsinoe australis TaxID=40998 RepID=A0A4U7B422_9PEZI|nr:aldehyde dehydrogenase-like protein 6 [Elsinoe australis]